MGRPSKRQKPTFSVNVIARRKALGWNGEELAAAARIPYPTLRDIEAGISKGLEENRQAIARALGVSMASLYAESSEQSPAVPAESRGDAILRELRIVLDKYALASEDQRLLALYILTHDRSYLSRYEALPNYDRLVAVALKKSL